MTSRQGSRRTARRVLWWIGFALQAPIDLDLLQIDGPLRVLERVLCLLPPVLDEWPSWTIPTLDTPGQVHQLTVRLFVALALGVVCWIAVLMLFLTSRDPEYEHAAPGLKQDIIAARILTGVVSTVMVPASMLSAFFVGFNFDL